MARRTRPESTTTRTPSMVRLVSAMLVASTTLRVPTVAGAQCSVLIGRRTDRRTAAGHRGRRPRWARFEQRLHATNLARAGEEHEHVAFFFIECALHDLRRPVARLTSRGPAAVGIGQERRPLARRIGTRPETSAGGHDDRRIPEQAGHARTVERRRHHEQLEIRRQVIARIERQRQPQVRLQAALVKLIEDHCSHAFERRIALQHAREHAFRDHFDARGARDARVEPHAIAQRCRRRFSPSV